MGVLDLFRLEGRVALVTGGVRGLGLAMAEALASAGASVVVTARLQDAADAAATSIAGTTGAKTLGVDAEVTKADSVAAMVARTLDAFGSLDILVNNAGINIRRPIEELREEEWDQVLDTNLKGPWLCCRAVLPTMKARGWGRVINLSSILGEVAMADRSLYCSSKGGLTLLTRTLALEWAQYGINVNAICPGPFATEMNTAVLNDSEKRARFADRTAQRRWADPKELGPAAVFLASEASSFVTGATLFVDGGYTAS